MKKRLFIILILVAGVFMGACSQKPESEEPTQTTVEKGQEVEEEKAILDLKSSHPECFDLDTSEGLNVLVFENMTRTYDIRLVSGSKDHFSWSEALESTNHSALTLEEAKAVLKYYNLPDQKIHLRPYQDASSYIMTIDDALRARIASAFENRYEVGEQFLEEYDPEVDGTFPGYPGFD